MQTTFKSLMMFAAAALTLASCEKDIVSENAAPEVSGEKITVKATINNAATRVSVSGADGDYSAVWDDGDAIDIVEFAGKSGSIAEDTAYQVVAAENIEIADELAMFEAELEKVEGDAFTYYAVYPGGNGDNFVAKEYQQLVLPMPAVQKPTAESLIDPKANVVIAKAETDAQAPDLYFDEVINAASYARMTIKGLPEGVTPKTVKFENKTISGNFGVNIAGCYWYMVNDGTYKAAYGASVPNATTTITVDQSEAQDKNVVWFGLAPIGEISNFAVTVIGSDDTEYVKTVTGASKLNFTAGNILNFSVTVENVENNPNLVYYNDFDVEKVSTNTNITSNTTHYKNEKGSGASTVTYSFNNMSIRTSYNSSESGNNIIFFGSTENYFTIENITVPTRNLNLQFGVSKAGSNSLISIDPNEFTVRFSENGTDWSRPIPYTAPTDASWVTASIDFTLPESTTGLYIKFAASVGSVYRLDDVKLTVGEGGKEIDYNEPDPAIEADKEALLFEADSAEAQVINLTVTNPDKETLTAELSGSNADSFTATLAPDYSTVSVAPKKVNETTDALNATLTLTLGTVSKTIPITQKAKIAEGAVETSATITFSQLYSDDTELEGITVKDSDIEITFNKGSSTTKTKYYKNGTSVRAYAGSSITISSEKTIVGVTFTFGTSDGTNAITASVGSFSSPTWTGSANSVTFTIGGSSGHRRISAITVTYLDDSGNTGGGTEPEQPTPGGDTASAAFNFASLNSDVTGASKDLDGVSYKDNDITIAFSKGTGTTSVQYYVNGTNVRVYQNNTITLSTSQGTITSVEFTCSSNDYATALSNATTTVNASGSVSPSANGSVCTFTVKDSNTLTLKLNAQTRFTGVAVTYSK